MSRIAMNMPNTIARKANSRRGSMRSAGSAADRRGGAIRRQGGELAIA